VRTLGLDPSFSAFGWCVYDSAAVLKPRRLVASGHEGTISDLVPIARFMHARSIVESLLRRFDVDAVGIESPAFDGGPFVTAHFGLMMFAMEPIFENRKDCALFDPTTLKLISTGKSAASKADMQKAVQVDRMSTEVVQSDESDAFLIAKSTARFFMLRRGDIGPDDLTEDEQHVFLGRTKKKGGRVVKTAHLFREHTRFIEFSRIPPGSVELPERGKINPEILSWLESSPNSPWMRKKTLIKLK
jgi:Holliday junction resolvasome RuvABC endonuclease subunit